MNPQRKMPAVCSHCKHPIDPANPAHYRSRAGHFIEMRCLQPGCGYSDWYSAADLNPPVAAQESEAEGVAQVWSYDFLLGSSEKNQPG
jgi:RNase P subunit RPR2